MSRASSCRAAYATGFVLAPDNGGMDPRPAYDVMGVGYSATRHEDPRIARAIWDALGDAASVANIGAGTGNYEPRDREVIAIEPSDVMRAQRRAGLGAGDPRHGRADSARGCERRCGHGGADRSALARSGARPRGDAADRAPARRSADIRRTSARAVLAHPRLPHRVQVAAERQRSEPVRAGRQRHGSDPTGARSS